VIPEIHNSLLEGGRALKKCPVDIFSEGARMRMGIAKEPECAIAKKPDSVMAKKMKG